MARRGYGEGTITQRQDGRWEARIRLEGGRRRSLYGATRQEVAHQLSEALHERERGIVWEQEGRTTVAEYFASWLETKHATREWRTWQRYDEMTRLHVLPTLGRMRLVRLTPTHLQRLYRDKRANGLSAVTVEHLHRMVHAALAHAERAGVVSRNVADLVESPRAKVRQVRDLWTVEEAKAFLAAIAGDRLEALYLLAMTSGLRQAELFGLRWRALDLDAGRVQVVSSLQRGEGNRRVHKRPKNEASIRTVVLTSLGTEALRAHRTRQLTERMAAGSAWLNSDLVFCTRLGQPLHPSNVAQRSLHPLMRAAGVPRLRFHDLRHLVATLLLATGVPAKVVSELLGHSDVGTTLRIYGHVSQVMHQQAMDGLDRLLRNQ